MMSFLKSFLSNEKSVEEKAMIQHDVLKLDACDDEDDASCADESPKASGGCCGGGCRQ